MARPLEPVTSAGKRILADHLPWVLVGLACVLSLIALLATDMGVTPFRWFLWTAGVLMAVVALQRRFRATNWADFLERLETSALLALVGFLALLNFLGMRPDQENEQHMVVVYGWGSGRVFFSVMAVASLASAMVVLLPSIGRRIIISLFVLFHFGGMITAATSIDPATGIQGPWVAKTLWGYVYRPYLEFLYMTNAYHFYSPNPGQPSLMWFAVHYTDDTWEWVKMPDRDNSPIPMHYQRMLALPEHLYQPAPLRPLRQEELNALELQTGRKATGDSWEVIENRRKEGSALPYHPPIPVVIDLDASVQYQPPSDIHKRKLAAAAQHLFANPTPTARREGKTIRTVKVYRVTQVIISPKEYLDGRDPLDRSKYIPIFMGEFDAAGTLVDPQEPFLYWYLPILQVDVDYPAGLKAPVASGTMVPMVRVNAPPPQGKTMWLDCVETHAAGYKK
jgi:hypothetical protein